MSILSYSCLLSVILKRFVELDWRVLRGLKWWFFLGMKCQPCSLTWVVEIQSSYQIIIVNVYLGKYTFLDSVVNIKLVRGFKIPLDLLTDGIINDVFPLTITSSLPIAITLLHNDKASFSYRINRSKSVSKTRNIDSLYIQPLVARSSRL